MEKAILKALKVLGIATAVIFVIFTTILWAPLTKAHTDLAISPSYGIHIVPVENPYDGKVITRYFHYGAGYTFMHEFAYKGFPDSMMKREGGASMDITIMRQFISTKAVTGPWVISGWINYTLPQHQIGCSFGNRTYWSFQCFDFEQQQSLIKFSAEGQ